MSKSLSGEYSRAYVGKLAARLEEPRRFLQVVAGPRQAGKTTIVRQALAGWGDGARLASADEPTLRDRAWIATEWETARTLARAAGEAGCVLALDEVHKVTAWSETVKRLWDQDTAARLPLRVVLLGSAPLLMQRGLTESLAGRFEMLSVPHWSFAEMRAAFGFDLQDYLCFGGYPGAAPLIGDHARWSSSIKDALLETTIARDVLLLSRVDKPALLRRLLELGCRNSGQVLSYTKMLGQLHDAGNTTTLAHYLELLASAGMLMGLQKFARTPVRQRASSPKLQVLNTALMTAQSGLDPGEMLGDPEFKGRLVESAVGAHLAASATTGFCELSYWREENHEVDFVLKRGRRVVAIEVKSGRRRDTLPGMSLFMERFRPNRTLLVGQGGIDLETFLRAPVDSWFES